MKIALLLPSLIRSGPVTVAHRLAHGLAEAHDVTVFYLEDRTDRELLDFTVPVRRVSFRRGADLSGFDIVHSHTIKADLFVALHRKKLGKAKTVTTLHNYAAEDLPLSYGKLTGAVLLRLWKWATARHDRIVVLSRHAEAYYRNLWKGRSFTCVHNGVACPSLTPRGGEDGLRERIRVGVIASAGGLNRRKGVDQIIHALTKLPCYELHVAGRRTAETGRLEELARTLGVEERVHFHGYVGDIASFIAAIDFFVVPSRSEGFSLALQEIACMQKPAICSDLPIFRELFTEGEVRFFEPENIESLVRAMEGFEKVGDDYAKRARARYLAEYTPRRMVENYLKIYRELADGK